MVLGILQGNVANSDFNIGRGLLNIENMPVLRDQNGPIGTPTSDEERNAIRLKTNQIPMVL